MINTLSTKGIDKIPIFIVLIASIARLYLPSLNTIILLVVLPALMIWCCNNNRSVLRDKYIRLYIFIMIWMLITTFTSFDMTRSLEVMKTIFGGFVISIIMYSLADSNYKNIPWLFVSYIISFAATLIFLNSSGVLQILDITSERLNTDDIGVNANDLAYYLFYITIIVSLLGWNGKNKPSFTKILLYGLITVLTLYASILTASRQTLVIVLPFIIISYVLAKENRYNFGKLLRTIIPLATVAVLVYDYYMTSFYEGSMLQQRMELDIAEDSRSTVLTRAFLTGLSHPLLGVGPGCYVYFSGDGSFSHCTYTELFATSGFITLFLFIIILYKALTENYRRYKLTHNKVFLYILFAVFAWSIYNFLYAFHTSPWLISFFFLLVSYSNSLYRRNLIS